MPSPEAPTIYKLTGNPAIDSLILKGICAIATALVTYAMTKLNINDPAYAGYLTTSLIGVLMMAAASIYGWILSKANQAAAVQAGINLTTSGNALAADGKTVVSINDGSTPPLPVTPATATEIVKKFST